MSDKSEFEEDLTGCMYDAHEPVSWVSNVSELWAEDEQQDNQFNVVAAPIWALKCREATHSARADANDEQVWELLSNLEVLCKLVTSAGDTVSEQRESVASALEAEFTYGHAKIFSSVTVNVASINEALDHLHDQVPLASSSLPGLQSAPSDPLLLIVLPYPLSKQINLFPSLFRRLSCFLRFLSLVSR